MMTNGMHASDENDGVAERALHGVYLERELSAAESEMLAKRLRCRLCVDGIGLSDDGVELYTVAYRSKDELLACGRLVTDSRGTFEHINVLPRGMESDPLIVDHLFEFLRSYERRHRIGVDSSLLRGRYCPDHGVSVICGRNSGIGKHRGRG